jgi:hypothetical protein
MGHEAIGYGAKVVQLYYSGIWIHAANVCVKSNRVRGVLYKAHVDRLLKPPPIILALIVGCYFGFGDLKPKLTVSIGGIFGCVVLVGPPHAV